MRAWDYLDEIVGAFRKQRLRTALTSLGIGIGAFAVTLMVGLGQGLQTYIEDQFLAFSNDRVLMVFPETKMAGRILDRLTGIGRPAKRMDEEDERERQMRRGGMWIRPEQVEALRKLPGVEAVEPMTWLEIDGIELVGAGSERTGWYETDFAAMATSPLLGTPIAGRKPAREALEVALAPQYTRSWNLPAKALVGREVDVRVPFLGNIMQRFMFRDPTSYRNQRKTFRARIVGLAEKSPLSRSVYVSVGLGTEMIRYQSGKGDLLSQRKIGFQAHLGLAPGADPRAVKKAVKALGLDARSISDQLREVQRVFLVVDLVLTSFGLLSVLVATLGIVNTLLMAIHERTREIGVMKALGMTRATIRRMFAIEAAAIGLVGGALGMGAAVGLGLVGNVVARQLIPAAQELEGYAVFHFPWWLLVGAPLFAAVVGALAGIYPANRAARLDPITALRRD